MTVRQLCESLGQDEFEYWIAYHQIEPLPDPWLMHAIQTSAFVNAIGAKSKPKDFMPPRKYFHRATPEEIISKINLFKARYKQQ